MSMKNTFFSSMSLAFSMATTMASRQRSTAMSSTSGLIWAVSAVNFPFPQPTSTHSAVQSGFRLRQLPRRVSGWSIR